MQIPPSWRFLSRLAFWPGVAGLIVISLTPGRMLPHLHGLDLLYHGLAYAGLASLAVIGYRDNWHARLALAGLVGLGIGLEFAQELVPGRSGSLADALSNAVGVGLIAYPHEFWRRRNPNG